MVKFLGAGCWGRGGRGGGWREGVRGERGEGLQCRVR